MADNNNKKPRRAYNEALYALDEIHAKYRQLQSTDIEQFTPVYYPIAMVDMELEEETFENFEIVQHMILQLYSYGITSAEAIAQTMALKTSYVEGVLTVLFGSGLIDMDGQLTMNGRRSLREDKQVQTVKVWQKFQVDALNGTLLRVNEAIEKEHLEDPGYTKIIIGHLNYMDGIRAMELVEQLVGPKKDEYLQQEDGILNTNVVRIHGIHCEGINWARCYMVKLLGKSDPIVFAKRLDSSKKNLLERFTWTPLFVPNEAIRKQCGFSAEIPLETRLCRDYVRDLYEMMRRAEGRVRILEMVDDMLQRVYPFAERGVDKSRVGASIVPCIKVDETAFAPFKSWILNFLIGIDNDGEYLLTSDDLYGLVIKLETDSPVLEEAGRLAAQLAMRDKGAGRIQLARLMKERFADVDAEDIIAQMTAYMRTLA